MINLERVIMEILQAVGVYEDARRKVSSDQELATMFDQNFDELIRLVSK